MKVFALLLPLLFIKSAFGCIYNTSHCNCMFSNDPTSSKCYRPVTQTTCLVDSCIAAYKCDCSGTDVCGIGRCGAWRPDVTAGDTIGSIVDCHYADSTSSEYASCIEAPALLASPSSSPSTTPSSSASASPSSSASTSPSTSASPSATPSTSPIVAQCPGGQNTFSMIDHIDSSMSYNAPKTISYPNGQSLSIWAEGMNTCNLYATPADPDANAPNAWKMRCEVGGTNGECASVPTTSRTLQNYVVHGIESDGTYYFQPTIEVFEVDYTALDFSNPSAWQNYPREVLGFVGFRDGVVVYPSVTIQNTAVTILEERTYTMPGADLTLLGESAGDINVPMVTVPDGLATHCTTTTWDTCRATFTFSEPISKLLTFGTATYNVPSITATRIDAAVNPFTFTCI